MGVHPQQCRPISLGFLFEYCHKRVQGILEMELSSSKVVSGLPEIAAKVLTYAKRTLMIQIIYIFLYNIEEWEFC